MLSHVFPSLLTSKPLKEPLQWSGGLGEMSMIWRQVLSLAAHARGLSYRGILSEDEEAKWGSAKMALESMAELACTSPLNAVRIGKVDLEVKVSEWIDVFKMCGQSTWTNRQRPGEVCLLAVQKDLKLQMLVGPFIHSSIKSTNDLLMLLLSAT